MADNLVVREWDIWEKDIWVDTGSTRFQLRPDIAVKEHNALANELADIRRAYLERDAQLAAMTAERDNCRGAQATSCAYADEWYKRAKRAEDKLTASEAEVKRRDLLLQDLTPGGSEYVNDPERCAAYAKDVKRNMQALAMKEIKLRKASEAARGKHKAGLEAIQWRVLQEALNWREGIAEICEKSLAEPGKAGEA